ncbi:TRAM domain-containing protein [Candidatus Daviesbacteria bacterium]|nr:TRAM domain-containing protein [Candidatus Daviesbacteria bacterium]
MSKFYFRATLVAAIILGLVGFLWGDILPLPAPFTLAQSKALYALIGVMAALLLFSKVASWVIHTTTHLFTQAVMWIATEVVNQFVRAASRGRMSLPWMEEEHHQPVTEAGAVILDTSSIIDGRITEVAKLGFLAGLVLVPEFVLVELQQVADSSDSIKRARGRRGFTIVNDLKKIRGLRLQIIDGEMSVDKVPGKTVDDKLVNLAKMLKAKILTCDFNLANVAKLRGITVLNLNELGNALKTLPLPGEKLTVKLLHPGKDQDQGVGYLADGAMVVVGGGANQIGKEIEVEITKILQGSAGRMIFAKPS